MSFATETVTATTTDLIPSTTLEDVTITVTSHLHTTLSATHGQTITIFSPSLVPPSSPTTKYTPGVITTTETSTATVTELDVYLQNARGSLYSTWVISLSAPAGSATSSTPLIPWVYVVEPQDGGWNSWSKGAKAGLIVGVVLAAMLLVAILLCCCKKRNIWFVHGWPGSAQVDVAPPPNPGPSIVQPTIVNGPLMPYPPGQLNYGHGYAQGMRGGGGSRRYFTQSYKEWFGKKQGQRKD
ncbi:hypothetical protein A1O3_02268 [Capronia epimyces CBS 606.96]|uniref:Uncharacterized protein n=1 Tax=Capronia epimyces CBS 606.96 TaxID=1182542 RepID=W9Y8L9_9EURO|nr:uncharacterized protein A1O3_02268 [Capronia epimyces CBS 606.96]EXJ89202.1 hypothetical protein A1O3_02268 [Capronia epimyces CBS 606.96]